MTCSHCGENRIEYDTAAGHAFCPKCGFVRYLLIFSELFECHIIDKFCKFVGCRRK